MAGFGKLMPAFAQSSQPKIPMQRVRPGDPGWPNGAQWQALSDQVGGRLQRVISPLDACKADPSAAKCATLMKDLSNPYYIQEQPWATQSAGWLDGWETASPSYVVIAKDARDVAAAINFARANNLRLVVKGGAHSYLGQSAAPDSLMIWTRDMDQIEMLDGFVPRGCEGKMEPVPAVSVASGAKFYQLYDVVTVQGGRYVQGGGCVTVGVGGHFQTGGFGSFSKYGGITAGTLLEAEIVTADGQILIANACQNADLLWALKGGGAGFGVTTRLTVATQDLPEHAGRFRMKATATNDQAFREMIGAFLAATPKAAINPHWGEQVTIAPDNSMSFSMNHQGLTEDEALAAWSPFLDWLEANPRNVASADVPDVKSIPLRDWWSFDYLNKNAPNRIVIDDRPGAKPGNFWWVGNSVEVSIYLSGYDSLWLPEALLAPDKQDLLRDALFEGSRHYPVVLHFNKGLAGATPVRREEARLSSIHPDAVDAFALMIVANGQLGKFPGLKGHEPDIPAARQENMAITAAFEAVRKVAPNAGSYSSEMSFHTADWQRAAWGPNYPRLLKIKQKYDPDGLFTGHHQVGSEAWSYDGFTRRS